MKTFFKFGLGMAAVLLASCSSNNLDEIAPNEEQSSFPEYNVTMTIPDFLEEDGTRTALTYDNENRVMSFAWAEGDVVGVYSDEASGGNLATFKIKNISASDPKSASFNGGGFRLIGGNSYTAVFPYNGTAIEQTSFPVNFEGQVQLINNGTGHLGAFDYMAASATASSDNVANFAFAHLGAIMRLELTAPGAGTYTSLKISAPEKFFIKKGVVNLLASTPGITYEDESNFANEYTLKLGEGGSGISLATNDEDLIIFLFIPPIDLTSQTLTFTLMDNHGSVTEYTRVGFNMRPGIVFRHKPTKVVGSISGSGSGYPFG